MPTSILQIPNYGQQQPEVLNTQNQDAILTQALTSTPNSQTFTAPQNFTSCNNQYPEIPKTESNNNYREVCVPEDICSDFWISGKLFISHNSGGRSRSKMKHRERKV